MDGQEIVVGAEVQEATEPVTTETEPVNPTAEAQNEGQNPTSEENPAAEPTADGKTEEDSRFASVRRKAEADAKARYEAETSRLNDRVKQICGNYVNPETGRPVETIAEYFDALEAQQRRERDEELRSKGVDPKIIEDMVNNSPVVRQANAVMQQSLQAEAQRQLADDVKAVGEIDPSIKSVDDLMNHPSYAKVYDLVSKHGLSLPDAYKIANYSDLSAKNTAAVKQAAINQAKGKNHLEATGSGVAKTSELKEVPASTMTAYKQFYPNLTEEQIKVKYNELMNNK